MNDMEELIRKARSEEKWLHNKYSDLWFSPSELEEARSNGRYRCGPVNWTLRDPYECLPNWKGSLLRLRIKSRSS